MANKNKNVIRGVFLLVIFIGCYLTYKTFEYAILGHLIDWEHQERIEYRFVKRIKLIDKTKVQFCDNLNSSKIASANDDSWRRVLGRKIMVFSAFYDNRKSIDGGPIIRIIASGYQEKFNKIGEIFCVFWFRESYQGINGGKAEYEVVYQSTMHPDMYTAHFIKCKVPNISQKPFAVTITNSECGIIENVISINYNYHLPRQKFGLCISPIYNKYSDIASLIEVVEMHRILGVEKITFYDYSVSEKSKKVLEDYQKQGLAEVIRWDYPATSIKCDYFAQREALNDCLYRNMRRVKFLAFEDIDEIIIPTSFLSWNGMIRNVTRNNRGALMFQHFYFKREKGMSRKEPSLFTQNSIKRPKNVFPAGKIRSKTIYKPKLVESVDIHFPHKLLKGVEEYLVPPEIGTLNHYRIDDMQSIKEMKNLETIDDFRMIRYKKLLTKRFNEMFEKYHH